MDTSTYFYVAYFVFLTIPFVFIVKTFLRMKKLDERLTIELEKTQ